MMRDMSEILKASTAILIYRKGDRQKEGNHKESSPFNACYKLYTKFLNKN